MNSSDKNYDTVFNISTDLNYYTDFNMYYQPSMTINKINTSDIIYTIKTGIDEKEIDFENYMPPLEKIKEMCEHYPPLASQYEKFKLLYMMSKDDYDGRKDRGEI